MATQIWNAAVHFHVSVLLPTTTFPPPCPTPTTTTTHYSYTMPPKTQAKKAPAVKTTPTSPPPALKAHKCSPSNTDETTTRLKTKRVKKTCTDDDAGDEGGMTKAMKQVRTKKPRCIHPHLHCSQPTNDLRTPTGELAL